MIACAGHTLDVTGRANVRIQLGPLGIERLSVSSVLLGNTLPNKAPRVHNPTRSLVDYTT